MRSLAMLLVLGTVTVASAAPAPAVKKNGTLLASTPYVFPAYDGLGLVARALIQPERLAEIAGDTSLELLRLDYVSDGLKVKALLYKPRKLEKGKKWPLVIWNRGGNEDAVAGDRNFESVDEMYRFAKAGFVVIAPQYRGSDGGEGKDELGGADTNDVLAVFPLAAGLGYVDLDRVFMHGFSRGGLMTLQAIRARAKIRAAAVVGPTIDWNDVAGQRPPFDEKDAAQVARRSPITWADEVTTPLLILQGGSDFATRPANALAFARKLDENGTLYEIHVFARDNHAITAHREERIGKAIDWFANPRKMSIGQPFERELRARGLPAAMALYAKLRKDTTRYDVGEAELNTMGYRLLFGGDPAGAVAVFELNTREYPKSANVWDSYGEGLAAVGRTKDAIVAYERSLKLDPKNGNAVEQLKKLRAPK